MAAFDRRTLRTQLVLLALATVLPMLTLAGVLVAWSVQDHRSAVESGAVETARALRTAVHREIEAVIGTLQVVATRDVFTRGDPRGMYDELRAVKAAQEEWATLLVALPDGRQLVNLYRRVGEPLPDVQDRRTFDEVVRTRRAGVSDVVLGQLAGEPVVGVHVPVVREGRVKYVLGAVVPARRFGALLAAQRLPQGWLGAIVDSQNRHVVRSRAHDRFVGQPLSPYLVEALGRSSEGWIPSRTLEGQPVYASLSRSDRTGWAVALGVPKEAVDVSFRRSSIGFGLAMLVAVGLAIGIATLVGGRVVAPLVALAQAAPRLVSGDRVTLPVASTAEVEALGQALLRASESRARTESELARTSRLLNAVFEGTSDAVFVKDVAGRYLMINVAGARLLGHSVDEVVGRTDHELFTPESADRIVTQDREIATSGATRTFENEVRPTTAEAAQTFLSTKAPYRDAGGEIIGVIGITRDISARKRVEADRARALAREQAARADAEAANRAKDEFLAMLSHELRTPLNAVYGWARMLRQGPVDPVTQGRALEVIERNASAQIQLIEDLLDISRIISGKMRLDVRAVELPTVVSAAVDTMRPAAIAREIRLHVILDPRAGPVIGDPDRLQQVVWNLVSNAVKFTPKNGRVDVTLSRTDSQVEIVVSDTGQGIAADVLPYVFDRFKQGDSTSTRSHGGLGLGLALVRHLVELHGGSVTAASAGRDQGARFTVTLPVAMLRPPTPAEPTRPRASALPPAASVLDDALPGVRVLVVDDDADALELVAAMLRRANAEPRVATSAVEGITIVRSWHPDVILSDLEMAGEDGYAFLRRVQDVERETGVRFPSVALTAYGRLEDRVRTLSAGFAMHLPKPVDPAELVAVIGALARRRR